MGNFERGLSIVIVVCGLLALFRKHSDAAVSGFDRPLTLGDDR